MHSILLSGNIKPFLKNRLVLKMPSFFDTSIEFLKGVGPQRAALIQKELAIFTYGDLIQHYPFRNEDRTKFHPISAVHAEMPLYRSKVVLLEWKPLEKVGKNDW